MGPNPSVNDPKSIWQSQPGETSKVTLVLVRKAARDMRAKTRRELFGIAWVQLAFAIFAAVGLVKGSFAGDIKGALWPGRTAFAAALLWCIAGALVYQRGMWTAPLAGDAGLETGIAFLRREIQRHRDLFHRWLAWVFCPIIFTLGAAVGPIVWYLATTSPKLLWNTIPFFSGLAGWTVAMVFLRIRRRRELQREIDDLNEIERENR